MSLYAIGDIHGCLAALKTIFDNHSFQPEDTIVFLGDYVDRGPEVKGVFDWLIKQSTHFNFVFLKGNHEIMMEESKNDALTSADWLRFGGAETLNSYGIIDVADWPKMIPKSHWEFMNNTLSYYKKGDFIFVHAGLEAGIPLSVQTENVLFWQKFVTPDPYVEDKTVICGHTSRKNGEIADFGHTICIDTFAYGGQWLTCLNVESLAFIKANQNGVVVEGDLLDSRLPSM